MCVKRLYVCCRVDGSLGYTNGLPSPLFVVAAGCVFYVWVYTMVVCVYSAGVVSTTAATVRV